jgi:toxin CptA
VVKQPPLLIHPHWSWQLTLLIIATHGLALVVMLMIPLDVYRWPLLALIGGSGVHAVMAQVLRRTPSSIQSALWQTDGSWLLTLRSGAQLVAQLSPATFFSLRLIVLNFRIGRWQRAALPLFSDALDAEQLRRLRVRLRINGANDNF